MQAIFKGPTYIKGILYDQGLQTIPNDLHEDEYAKLCIKSGRIIIAADTKVNDANALKKGA